MTRSQHQQYAAHAATIRVEPESVGVVEYDVAGKSPDVACEDRVVVTADFIAVIDGMSSPLRGEHEQPSGAAYAEAIGEVVAELERHASASEAFEAMTAAAATVEANHRGPTGAVIALLSLARRELWRVGDVHLRIGEVDHLGSKRVDELGAEFRAFVNLGALASGTTTDEIRAKDPGLRAIGELLRVQEHFANRSGEFGYGVLNGQQIPDQYIEVYELGAAEIEVALATDGYLSAAATLAEAEEDVTSALHADPACLGPRLREMGKAVQPGAAFPDDRCYVRVRLAAAKAS